MNSLELGIKVPNELVTDFASDPLSQYDKVLQRSEDTSWPLHPLLKKLVDDLPEEAISMAFADENFIGIYGRNEKLARTWFVQRLLNDEVSRLRLNGLSIERTNRAPLPYTFYALDGIDVDDDWMVQLREFSYDGSSLTVNGFSFTTFLVNQNFNSTYWLQQAFFNTGVSDHVRVRLDPFLFGQSDQFPSMMYKMLVYAKPLNWDGIAKIKCAHFGQMRPDSESDRTELTEFCWEPRDDGIHFVCEELPRKNLVEVQAARYLHAIYDPKAESITHFDGALRIYTRAEMETRLKGHVRSVGKSGIRRKVFRIDAPINREAFSLISQAFFIWNYDLSAYFREQLSARQPT